MKNEYNLDDGIAELVYQFNRLGLRTAFSCQGHSWAQKPYIMFECDEDVLKNIIIELHQRDGRQKYLNIGYFYKLCQPIIEKNGNISINNKWMWEGKYWTLEEYNDCIGNFALMLSNI